MTLTELKESLLLKDDQESIKQIDMLEAVISSVEQDLNITILVDVDED